LSYRREQGSELSNSGVPIKGRIAVIGEDMGRVKPFAKRYGYEYFETKSSPSQWMRENRAWIRARMDEGYTIVDLGPAPGRANYPYITSDFYRMELGQILGRSDQGWLPIWGEF